MPTYDYRCPSCETQFHARHAMAASAPACPRCGGRPERIIVSAPAVHGHMARGREAAARTLEPGHSQAGHPAGCPCCH